MNAPASPSPRPRSFPLVWVVPLVALVASGWLLHRQYRDRGPVIEIDFANGAGLSAGKTPVFFKGVEVGLVEEVALTPEFEGVRVRVVLDAGARLLATTGAEFWLVRPEIGLSGVRGLDTLLSGARIEARPGTGAPARRFTARAKPPAQAEAQPGRTFVLRTATLGSLQAGTAVYFRDVKVGLVEHHRLSPDSTQVLVGIRVFAPYDALVRTDTRFWNSGGLDLKVGLLGAQVHTNSLEALVAGGVAFATPEMGGEPTGGPAPEGTAFDLHREGDRDWLKWTPRIPLDLPTP